MTNVQVMRLNEVIQWEEAPFAFEHAMSGYILENPQILRLNDSNLSDVTIIDSEVKIGHKRDRADIVVAYNSESSRQIAIVELKNVIAIKDHLDQLKKYMAASQGTSYYPCIGILVAPDFDDSVMSEIKGNKDANIYGLKLMRYERADEIIVITEIIYPNLKRKDYTKYQLTNLQGQVLNNLSKSKLVWRIIYSYIEDHPNETFESLRETFPDEIQSGVGKKSIHLIARQEKVAENLRCRYASKHIILNDNTIILVSNQWGIGNIDGMINKAIELGMKISTQN